jgi:iron-sulfur cluster repair protein YtfE (RIC family)
MPSLRITSLMAKVRIRRLVQNGMVIRNSHIARCCAGRVAMNQAVGKPKVKVSAVVASDSQTERQKIVRCASASA